MHGSKKRIWWTALLLLPGSIALGLHNWLPREDRLTSSPPNSISLPTDAGMVRLSGGWLMMGSPRAQDVDARPLHRVHLKPFWLDAYSVTNRQFQQFVASTQYVTDAERRGSSLVFDRKQGVWREVVGVNWRNPEAPNSSLVGKEAYPVVHVTWQDAATYAAWAKKRLPTEAEYEYAARSGLSDSDYPWGQQPATVERPLANGWQGRFPEQDTAHDGFRGTSPVDHFPPSRFGLYDMAGNVWNWCADWYAADYYGASLTEDPQGPTTGSERVRRGGSWLSAENYGGGLRVDYRDHAPPGESTNHTGFRCARDE